MGMTHGYGARRRCVPRLRCLVVLPTRDLAAQVFKVSAPNHGAPTLLLRLWCMHRAWLRPAWFHARIPAGTTRCTMTAVAIDTPAGEAIGIHNQRLQVQRNDCVMPLPAGVRRAVPHRRHPGRPRSRAGFGGRRGHRPVRWRCRRPSARSAVVLSMHVLIHSSALSPPTWRALGVGVSTCAGAPLPCTRSSSKSRSGSNATQLLERRPCWLGSPC